MKFALKTFAFIMLVSAAFLTASAQDQTIKFTLSGATQVGSVDLPAGSYRMKLSLDSGMRVVSVSGEGKDTPTVKTVARAADSSRACSGTSLKLKRADGKLELAAACFSDADLALEFSPVAAKKAATVSASAASAAEKATSTAIGQ